MPSYLSKKQRKLILDSNYAQRLTEDPITMTMDGERYKFTTLKLQDTPNSQWAICRALDAFRTGDDWKNLEPLLVGMRQAGRGLPSDIRSKIIRKAAMTGRMDALWDFMRQANRTGFYLNTHETVATAVASSWRLATIEGNFEVGNLTKAITRCTTIFEDIMPREGHADAPLAKRPHERHAHLRFQLLRDPQLLGAFLGLHAARVLAINRGMEERKDDPEKLKEWRKQTQGARRQSRVEVPKLARLVSELWKPKFVGGGKGLKGLHPEDAYFDKNWVKYLRQPNKRVEWQTILARGFEDAADVLMLPNQKIEKEESERHRVIAQRLRQIANDLRKEAAVDLEDPLVKDNRRGMPRLGRMMWNKVVPPAPLYKVAKTEAAIKRHRSKPKRSNRKKEGPPFPLCMEYVSAVHLIKMPLLMAV